MENNIAIANSKSSIIAKDIALIVLFSILTGLAANIKIEIGAVPITMQTLVVLLSGVLLGSKKGAISQITYLCYGLAGLGWFAHGGGLAYIASPTFGYVIGFILAAYLAGLIKEKNINNPIAIFSILVIANWSMYLPGLLWLSRFVESSKLLAIGFYPFIIGDLIKISLVKIIIDKTWKRKI